MKSDNKKKRTLGHNKCVTAAKGREAVPFTRSPLACCLAAVLSGAPMAGYAAPQGGQVTGGEGSIDYGQTTTVTQDTSRLAIDWQTFDVAADETVRFNQPASSSVVLNRILDQNPSEIFGSLEANGRLFLSNPNGLIFGESATVNAGAFVASGLDISSDDFMAGNYRFGTADADGGVVVNRGVIAAADVSGKRAA